MFYSYTIFLFSFYRLQYICIIIIIIIMVMIVIIFSCNIIRSIDRFTCLWFSSDFLSLDFARYSYIICQYL